MLGTTLHIYLMFLRHTKLSAADNVWVWICTIHENEFFQCRMLIKPLPLNKRFLIYPVILSLLARLPIPPPNKICSSDKRTLHRIRHYSFANPYANNFYQHCHSLWGVLLTLTSFGCYPTSWECTESNHALHLKGDAYCPHIPTPQ